MYTTYPKPFPPPWAKAWGDDPYGLWAVLDVKGAIQRMRWIAPGSFMMGSNPKLDPHHRNDETQHPVTLTHGFWLADTTCTQALWQAVMGTNPSLVADDPGKPVEQVSWDDVQDFFKALAVQEFVPEGFEACLPTEAQWEYACRAGSPLVYHFADTVSTVWCNHDHDGGSMQVRLETKHTTLPAKALLANHWGLHQMHGNVWEWCADGLRTYTVDAVSDPEGPKGADKDARFAVRGGSWDHYALLVRSAQRNTSLRFRRFYNLGFRFALRSKEPGS